MTLRIGLNLLHLVPNETGGSELYARRLVPALLAETPGQRLVVFCASEAFRSLAAEPWAGDVELVRMPVSARSRVQRVLAEQVLLPRAVRRARIDLLHNLFTTAPAFPSTPQVTTILDLIYKRYPETHSGVLRYGVELLVPLAARRSKRVITISEAAKADIVRFLGVPSERIDVTPLGPALDPGVEPVPEDEIRSRFHLDGRPLVLTVSAKRPHKNLERLFEAISRVPGAILVVPGYTTAFEDDLRARAAALPGADRIRFTGWVDDGTLEGLYRTASCFVFPSLAEGFGLPVLDALSRGVPTACSNTTSLPEVAGDAAVYFDPTDTGAIANAIERLLADGDLRAMLAVAGPEQAKRFSWKRTAVATLASYERTGA